MKKSLILTLGILLMASSAFADIFIVAGYKHDPTNLAARVYQRKDNNDETCGLIMVRTSILNLKVLANTGVVGPVNFKDGDYWVYVSPGTRRISFYKQGFVRLDYDLPTPVKSGETYLLDLRYRRTDNSSAVNKMGFVVINSQPTGADVYINDSATGMQTPFQNPYPEGYYRFKLKKPFYDDYPGNFEIHGSKTSQVSVKLVPDFGALTVNTKPEINATVNIDGEDKGTTPVTVKRLPPGKHTLHLNKEMYLPWQSSFTISRGNNTQRTITMKANFGTVTVNAHEGDAIYIDNLQVGTASYSGRFLRGSHIIRVEHKNYYTQSKQINVTPGQNLQETIILKPKTGILSVMTTPIGADIFIDEKLIGQSPKIIDSLKVGNYTVKLQKQGYATVEKQVIITENQITTIRETLANGINVQFTSQPSGSELYVDGQYKGTTPLKLSVNFGEHTIRLVNGKHTIKKNIIFSEKSPPKLNFIILMPFVNYTETTQNLNLAMVAVKGGTFQMGSNNGNADEKPVHSVTLSNYYIGKYEVTQKQWKDVMGKNPSYFKGRNLPVEQVSWNDVQEFLRKLNQITGKHYRLPTEAEWEYAARGGAQSSGYQYSGSDNTNKVAWYGKNSGNKLLSGDWKRSKIKSNNCKTHTVGTKKPNELGIYNMSGNVWEWCNDWYNKTYYKESPKINPKGPSSGVNQVIRGGSWNDDAVYCRVAFRSSWYPAKGNYFIGFRLALSVP